MCNLIGKIYSRIVKLGITKKADLRLPTYYALMKLESATRINERAVSFPVSKVANYLKESF